MGGKAILKTKIYGDRLRQEIEKAGYSIRGLAKEIGTVGEWTIRTYLKRNEMPEYILRRIDDVIRPKGKMLLMTVDVLVPVTNDELKYFLNVYDEEISEKASCRGVGVMDVALKELMKRDIQVMNGYVPDSVLAKWLTKLRIEKAGVTLSEYLGRDLVKRTRRDRNE